MKHIAALLALTGCLLLGGCMSIAANAFQQATAYRYHPQEGVVPASITRTVEASGADMEANAPLRRISVYVQEVDGDLVTTADKRLLLAPGKHTLLLHAALFDETFSANQFEVTFTAAQGQHYTLDLDRDEEDDFVVTILQAHQPIERYALGL